MSSDNLYIYAAAYENEDEARDDLTALRAAALVGVVGEYDTALLTKKKNGKVSVEKHGTETGKLGWAGALAGGVLGLLFPPTILAGAAVGGAVGAITGKLWGGMSRSDLKDLGEVLDVGEWGLVVVAEGTLDEFIEKSWKRAKKRIQKEVKADRKELKKELKELEAAN